MGVANQLIEHEHYFNANFNANETHAIKHRKLKFIRTARGKSEKKSHETFGQTMLAIIY